jgi:hypothetical protein
MPTRTRTVAKTQAAQTVASTPAAPVATPAPAPATTPAPAPKVLPVVKPMLAPRVAPVAAAVESSSAAETETVLSQTVDTLDSTSGEQKLSTDEVFELALKDAQNMIVAARGMVARVRELKKASDRELRESKKSLKKTRKVAPVAGVATTPRSPTGFAKPCRMKDSLFEFLRDVAGNTDLKRDDLITRTEVTKRLNKYIIANSLRDPEDQRKILYTKDSKLSPLITLPPGVTELSYFNLQTAIKDLFEKAPVADAAAVQSSA